MPTHSAALLVLETGEVFSGELFGATPDPGAAGEVCFNTSMTGYQEVLTDPSYAGQIVTMTCPHIGNYGTNPDDVQSSRIQVAGFVVRELSRRPSNWRSTLSLDAYLAAAGVGGITQVDTRALTRRLRSGGVTRGAFGRAELGVAALMAYARAAREMGGCDLTGEVTSERLTVLEATSGPARVDVAVYDFGIKQAIVDALRARGCRVRLYPARTPAREVLASKPAGVLLSNGPGDPEAVTHGIDAARELLGKVPVFGICLGHQILALACGARTYKLAFGHRGSNHPVRELATGRILITAQNHGFAVDPSSLPPELAITHESMNDGTIEGLAHTVYPAWSVQHHPEASPGPHDSCDSFDRFVASLASS